MQKGEKSLWVKRKISVNIYKKKILWYRPQFISLVLGNSYS